MKLYLVRHGLAITEEEDQTRPLSPEGTKQVTDMRSLLQKRNIHLDRVFHSPKLRAEQTATIISRSISEIEPQGLEALKPSGEVEELKTEIEGWSEDTMLVGHLPLMTRLVSVLVGVAPDITLLAFRPGSIVCLEKTETQWVINWMLRPILS